MARSIRRFSSGDTLVGGAAACCADVDADGSSTSVLVAHSVASARVPAARGANASNAVSRRGVERSVILVARSAVVLGVVVTVVVVASAGRFTAAR